MADKDQERALGSHMPRTDEAMETLKAQEEERAERPAPEAGKVSDATDPEYLHPQHGEFRGGVGAEEQE